MSDEQLSDIFKRDLPRQGDGNWADDARKRHGRRRGITGAVAVLAAVALVTPFALQMVGGNGGVDTAVPGPIGTSPLETVATEPASPTDPAAIEPASPSVATDEPTQKDDPRAAACSGAGESAVDELPTAAAKLWLCDEPGQIGFSHTGPAEALTQGVQEALDAFQALDKADPNMACTQEYRMTYVVVAEAANGTTTPVAGELHGCRTIGNRLGAEGYLNTLAELWAAQRAESTPPETTATAEDVCSGQGSILPATPEQATTGAMCAPDTFTGEAGSGELLDPSLAAEVGSAVAADSVEGTVGEWEPTATLVLRNAWGESVRLTRFASGTYQWNNRIWRPHGDLAAKLDAALATLDAPAPQEIPLEPRNCGELPAQFATSPATIEGEVNGVSICVVNRDGEPRWFADNMVLWEPQFVQRAVDAFNDLPALVGECSDTSRADVYANYLADGTTVASVKVASCGPATGAVAKDGPEFIDTLHALFREQSGSQGVGIHYGVQELCPQADPLVKFDPSREPATQIAACVGPEGELPIDVAPTLVEEITAGFRSTAAPASGEWAPGGGTLIWVNKYGEPMSMVRGEDGSFQWPDGDGAAQQWTPTGAVKEQLDRIFGL